jgi:hypothetical protein
MQKQSILILLGLLLSGAAHAQAYKWTDDDGIVHYSDRPQPGAERVDLGTSNSARRTRVRQPAASVPSVQDTGAAETAAPFRYESLTIGSPAAEETLWNIEGVLTVTLALSPALQPGHQVRVYFDGNARPVAGTSFQLQEVYRGAHNLQAEILDETGALMIRSVPSRFYVQQNSVL